VFDVYVLAVFGLVGYATQKLDCEPAPFLLGFVLGDQLEEHLRRSLSFSSGDPMIFLRQPISAGLLVVGVVLLVIVMMPIILRKRDEVFVEE
jgi:TctA family transporter